MCSVRVVCKCVVIGGKRVRRGNVIVTLLATAVSPVAPAVLPLSLPTSAGAAPAEPTPSCCLGLGGLSAT